MHVHLKRAGAIAFLATAGGLLTASCVPDESSLFIRGCVVIPRDTCLVTPSTTASFLAGGFIDAVYRSEYTCFTLIENQLVARGDVTKLRTETSGVTFYEAEVQVLTVDQPPKLVTRSDGTAAQFTVPVTGFADPGNGGTPGLGLAGVTMIDFATLKDLKVQAFKTGTVQQVVSSVIVRGRTTGGLEVQTDTFKFPIDICGGCLCTEPTGSVCAGGSTVPTPDCALGQDSPAGVDCRLLNACAQLECNLDNPPNAMNPGQRSLASAHCPANPFAVDGTCCSAQ